MGKPEYELIEKAKAFVFRRLINFVVVDEFPGAISGPAFDEDDAIVHGLDAQRSEDGGSLVSGRKTQNLTQMVQRITQVLPTVKGQEIKIR